MPARAELNALLAREPDAPLPEPSVPSRVPRLRGLDELRDRMQVSSPALAVAAAAVDQRAREVRETDLDGRSDWTVALDWIPTGDALQPSLRGSGDDAVMIGVRTAIANDLDRDLARLAFEFRNAEREVRLHRDTLLPKARQSLQASENGFRAGTVTVSDLVEAQQVLLQFELAVEDARARREIAVAELRAIVGGDVLEGTSSEGGEGS